MITLWTAMLHLLILCLALRSHAVSGSPLSSGFLVQPEAATLNGAPLLHLPEGGSKLAPTYADSGAHYGTLTVTEERSSSQSGDPKFFGDYATETTEGAVNGGSSISGQCNNKLAPPSSANIINTYCRPNKTGPVTECYRQGNSVCRCQGGVADCSGKPNIPNIDFVPKLPKETLCVNFANNNVQALTESYFANVSHIHVLDFSNNNLGTVSAKTFARFSDLKYLVINDNPMKVKNLKNVLNFAPKLRLDLSRVILDLGVFMEVQNMSTQEIVMDFNYIQKMDLSLLSSVRGLKTLVCRCCSINNVVTATMPTLSVLDLRYNNISMFPETCRPNLTRHRDDQNQNASSSQPETRLQSNASLFPALTQLFLDGNCLLQLPERTEVCLSKMNVLSLARNNITRVPYKFFASFTKLSRLDFGKMNVPVKIIENGSFGAPYMSTLYLNRNNISFSDIRISKTLFQGADRLGDLFIDHNQIGSLPETDLEEVFKYTVTLRHLYMSDTGLTSIPVRAFSRLTKLQSLFLYNNKIQTIPDAAFDSMSSLKRLLLQNNQISVVRESSFSPATIANLTEIDLSRNMFLCNCDLLWFQEWLRSNASHVFDHPNSYICSDLHNFRVQDYEGSVQACLMSRANYVIFLVCLCLFLFFFLLFVTVYRYRWHIRLMLYERRTSSRDLARLQGDYKYDLFIIYCNDDNEWVEKELLYVLEKRWQLKACIHARDFRAGAFIFDNMVDCMNSSKRIMAVVSSRFAQSRWCNFELMLCQSHVITHDLPTVLVIQMDKIQKRFMDSSMIALYNTTSFLELPDPDTCTKEAEFPQHMNTFWDRLHRCLQNLMPKTEKNVRQLGTQTSFSGQVLPATPHSPSRRPLLRQMSEQPPGRGSRPLRRLKSEMHAPLTESDEQSEETSVMHT